MFECSPTTLTLLSAAIAIGLHYLHKYWFGYWARNGIPSKPAYFPFGNTKDLILKRKSAGDSFRTIYEQFRKDRVPFGGFYFGWKPMFMIVDPEMVKNVLVKDFSYFSDRDVYVNEKNDPLTGHLFSLRGLKWKNLRTKLTPTFTSGKMKSMFHTLVACSKELENILEANHKLPTPEPLEIKDILARFTTDVIGCCAFGIDCNCLRDPEVKFKQYGNSVFEPQGIHVVKQIFFILAPEIMKFLKFKTLPAEIESFFLNIVKDTVAYRENNNITRKDFMQLLIQLKNKGVVDNDDGTTSKAVDSKKEGLTIEEVAAQAFVFFLAGFETSSTTMTFCLFELAQNLDIQEKLREEIQEMLSNNGGQYTYEGIMGMPYMDKVINETLRKYPPLPFLARGCKQDYQLPGTNAVLKKGSMLRISIVGIHRDPEYYPDPEKYDPERFSEEQKAKRVPYTFIPFGEGPRICIGLRFGVMQAKLGLAVLLRNYRFTLNSKTTVPLVMEPKNLIMSAIGGIWLDTEKVQ